MENQGKIHALMEVLMDQCEIEASNAQSVLELQKGFRWGTLIIGSLS